MQTMLRFAVAPLLLLVVAGCAVFQPPPDGVSTRDKTKRGAAIGAAAGAVLGAVLGEGEADEILAGAAIGAGIGTGVGAYMDRQEAKLARIPGTSVERIDDEMILVHFDSDLLFDVDSAILSNSARASLDDAAAVLREYEKTAVIAQGHTDSTGSESHNQGLSERRAQAVTNHLITAGVDAGRIAVLGYGESEPIADNQTAAGRALNRRVDLLLKAKVR